jgi:Sulfotransferase family
MLVATRPPVALEPHLSVLGSHPIPTPGPAGPIFVAGPDRTGTTLIYALLASHSRISMVRRTNMWRYFDQRYGDLSVPDNFERCLRDMLRFKRLRHLRPNGPRIRNEFRQGEPSYGRLFALFHEHNAERVGRSRWGDKSLHTEHHADRVFAEYPSARIIHMTRDPRDRYASVRKRHDRDRPRLGGAMGRWLLSMRRARRNLSRHPDGYMILRYEDLVQDPAGTMARVCDFIGERFEPEMMNMAGAAEYREHGGNSSFGDVGSEAISTVGVGRFRAVLSASEIAFIQMLARTEMDALGYRRDPVELHDGERIRFYVGLMPVQLGRLVGWMTLATVGLHRGERIPPAKLHDELLVEAGEPGANAAAPDSIATR